MKNIYSKSINACLKFLVVMIAFLFGNVFTAEAQVRVNFTQRTSQYTPNKKIYNIKGDFTMLGNTCLTPQNYGDNTNNNGQYMTYVDMDNDPTTLNSSAATLQLSTENGAIPSCSNIIYAGLYWTGKSSGSNTFTTSKTIQTGTQAVNSDMNVIRNQNILTTNYALSVSRAGTNNNRYPVYTFTGNGNTYAFTFFNNNATPRVTLSVNGGTAVTVAATVNGSGTEALLTTPYSITDGAAVIKIKKLIRNNNSNQTTTEIQTQSTVDINVSGNIPVYNTVTKNYDKRVISLKGPGAANYTQFTAAASDIYYPTTTDDAIFTAYKEITDYVRTNGIGQYWAADLPLLEGNVGGTGYSGGWGIIVVYENQKMKYRDVTIFDGYAYVESTNTSGFTLPVSGFNTVQSGNVGVKLGVMASEGDVAFTGDYFRIQKNSDSTYMDLSHSNNTTTNFFNSSINAGGARIPSLPNNTGIDIAMFNVPNANNSVIANNQTSTNFKYGTDGDTYSIFAIAMAVDAYIPEVEGVLSATTINGSPAVEPYSALPGQDIGFNVDIKNTGTEAINNYKVIVPIPFNATYVPGSAVGTILFTPLPTPNNVYFDPTLGATGSIVWDLGKLPLPANPSTLLAKLTFKLKETTDCQILANASCGGAIKVNGVASGVGATTGITFSGTRLIQGYTQNGVCIGSPISQDLSININGAAYVTANCQNVPIVRNFAYCNNSATVSVAEIASNFPAGSLFYDSFPVTVASVQFTASNPFPLVAGSTVTYYAVPPTGNSGCNYPFTISKCKVIIANDDAGNSVNGLTGGTSFTNVLGNDTLNGVAVLPSQVNLTFISSTNPGVTLVGSNVVVAAGTPSGNYILTYQICETASPTNCDTAIVTVTVTNPVIDANADVYANASCTNGGLLGNVLVNDLLNGNPVALAQVNFTLLTGSNPNIVISNTGNVTLTAGIATGTYTFTYKICEVLNPGNCDTATITITVTDTTAPVIAPLPGTTTISCPATPAFAQATATDSCSTPTLTFVDTTTPGNCAGSYTKTRTWTATDGSGNTSTASQTIIVQDTTAPVIAQLPAPSTISCPATPVFAQATATDACGSAFTLTSHDVSTPGLCAGSYSVTRTWTAIDACGNSSTASQTINVQDTEGPAISKLPLPSTITCPATPQFEVATAVDLCGSAFTLTSHDVTTPGQCTGSYSITRTWTAIDACGNTSTAFQTINVIDTTAPVIAQLPAASTISCPATPVFAQATANDACGSLFTLTSHDVTTPGQCAGSYSVTRTWTATDICGNASTASQTINVTDTTAPVIAELPAPSTISCPATPVFVQATAIDACGSLFTLTSNDVTTPGQCAGSYSVTRTWTATDTCGNASTASQTINVTDTTAPVIAQLPAPSTISCPATPVFAQATATDACGSSFTLTSNDVTTNGQCTGSYSVTRTWTATDACGNTSTASQTINVEDTTAPVISNLPATSTISCPATPEFAVATAVDACGSAFTLTSADTTSPGACAGSYAVTRTWTATDACGNTSTASQTINVIDTTAPVIAQLPATTTISCPATPEFAQATATDACGSTFTLTSNDVTTNGQCAGSYSVTRTWTATDACGNTSTATQTINVEDTTAPVIAQLPATTTISCPATPEFAQANATDACGSTFTLTSNDVTTNGQCAGSYSVTRTWTATDACGNTSTATQTINVQDVTAPVIAELPATSTISCPATPQFAEATATDACGSTFTLTSNDVTTNGQCAGSYSVTRTWTATDACGNISHATQTINVEDTTAPVIAALPVTTTISCPATPEFAQATATDACGSTFTLTSEDVTTNGLCAGSYSVTRTWTATDACGNISHATQTINVEDTIAPVIASLPATTTISCPATPEFAQAIATDACGSTFTLTSNDVTTNGQCAGSYSVTRTWTATDACGNTSTATQTINVEDVTAPVINTQASNITVECDGSGNQNAINDWLASNGGAAATDACSDVVWTNNFNSLASDCSAAVTVIFTATDACGNASSTSATFSVQDVTPPATPEAPATVTVACASEVPAAVTLSANDNCVGVITATGVDATTPGNCPNSYVITRTWTFTDACNNSSSVSQTINVIDDVAPVAPEAPATVTVACTAEVPSMISLTASDNCGDQITAQSVDAIVQGNCPNSYVITRTWTFTDACNNTSSVSQTINVIDNVAPIAPEAPATVTVACTGEVPAMISLTASDNCGDQITAEGVDSVVQGNCPNSYVITRTWTFTDACGNTSTAAQTINVVDDVAPVAPEAPAAVTVECTSAIPAMISLTASDNCGDQITAEGVDTVTPGNCPNSYTVTRTWTFTDACGNSSSTVQTITVTDTQAPVIAQLPTTTTISCPATPEFAQATATDNCGTEFTLTSNDVTTQGTCAGSYSVTRTWTATDICGNVSTATQTINVEDVTAPVINTQASNIIVECDGQGNQTAIADWLASNGGATATDACSDVTWTNNFNTLANDCSAAVTVVFTATDACGNASTTSATFSVQDVTAPVAPEAPLSVTVTCASEVPAAVALSATDNCTGVITATGVDATTPGNCPNAYVITRTWTFTDACNNSSSVSQTITVIDNVAPVIAELPATSTISCPATPEFTQATATDNCGGEFTLTSADVTTNGQCAGSYSVTRTWTATDACGNTSTATQTINVEDTTAPVIAELPATATISCPATPEFAQATATDACGSEFTLTSNDVTTQGTCAGSYSVTRTWTATDACGNTSTATQTINVEDTTGPVIAELPATSTIACPATPEFAQATATDACGSTFTLTSADVTTPGICAGSYSVTRTWTATDACGNVSTATQTINVEDTTAPVIDQLPAASTISCPATPVFAQATASDNCGSVFTLTSADVTTPGACAGSYSVTRTWTATDACGNVSTASQTVNVEDTTAPVISGIGTETTIECPNTPAFDVATATDDCGSVVTLTFADVNTPEANNGYTVVRTWTAVDGCGNASTASQIVHVRDTQAPVVPTLPILTAQCSVTATAPDAMDACAGIIPGTTSDPLVYSGEGTYVIHWTFSDGNGNSFQANQTVIIDDTIAPDAIVLADVSSPCQVTVPTPTTTDNCGGIITGTPDAPTHYGLPGTYVITWTFDDGHGNITTATQNAIVTPDNAPVPVTSADATCNKDNAVTFDLNSYLPAGTPLGGTWVGTDPEGISHLTGSIFSPYQVSIGNHIFNYVVADGDCSRRVELTMSVGEDCIVEPACDFKVINAFTPNGDGNNDEFIIENLDQTGCFPTNKVEIYNRWGILVFETTQYDNNTHVFRGRSEGRVTVDKGSLLPTGTYFYVIQYFDNDSKSNKERKGYLYLSR